MSDPRREEHPPAAPIFRARGWLLVEWSALLAAATLLVGGLLLTGATTRLDNAIYDFTLKFRHRPAPPDIVIVGVDFPSMSKLGPWPWPRQTLAATLGAVARGHPRAIVFQFLVASKSSPAGDEALRAAVAGAPVFLPEVLDVPGRAYGAHLIKPIAEIASVAAGVGLSNPTPDGDGIVRRTVLYVPYMGRALPELAVLVAGRGSGGRVGDGAARQADLLIPFAGPPGHFDQVSAVDVLQGQVDPASFKDKYVLVGPTAPGLLDNYPTPGSGADGMSSVEIEANTLDAILHHHQLRALPSSTTVILSLVLLWMTFFELLWLKPTQFALQPIGSLAIVVGSAAALVLTGVWFPPMAIVIARTAVQIVWSSRRLQAASDYFARELAELQTRAGGAILPAAGRGLRMGDSVTRQMVLIEETKSRVRELRRFVTDVLANFPDPVMVVTPQGRIVTYNQAAIDLARRLGRSAAPGSRIQPILQDLAAAAGARASLWPPNITPGALAPRGVGPLGRILEARYTPTGQEDGGEVKGWTVHLADVTAQVSAHRQREEALQLFTHDMRAPQSAILAALEHEDFRSVPQASRDRVARNAMRTLALADGFVRLAQAESAESYTLEPIDLFHLLGDAADALWSIARAASVEIVVEDPEREYVVDADRGLLARALINLLDNAVKSSPPSTRVVCALAETRLRDRPAVSCVITDQSDGMTGEQQRGLFDPFARPALLGDNDAAWPDPDAGVRLGLGLAMVQTVVHRHDGVIECSSEKGRGTVFTITFPICMSEEASVTEEAANAAESSSRRADPRPLKGPRLAIQT